MAELAGLIELVIMLVGLFGGFVPGWLIGRRRKHSFAKAAVMATFISVIVAAQLPGYICLIRILRWSVLPPLTGELHYVFDEIIGISYGLAITVVVVWFFESLLAIYLVRRKEYLMRRKNRRKE